MRNLGFVPARGGSKRLPRKNLEPLGGEPLVRRAVASALESGCFERLLVSTDDPEIADCIQPTPSVEVEARAPELAGDRATVLEAVLELMERWEAAGRRYDTITILLPTCPFRKPEHVRAGFERLRSGDYESVVSVTEYDFPWEMALDLEEASGAMQPALPDSALVTGNTRSQDRRRVYHPNGAFYIGRWEAVLRDRNFFKGRLGGLPMDAAHSADVDTPFDLKLAKLILEEKLV